MRLLPIAADFSEGWAVKHSGAAHYYKRSAAVGVFDALCRRSCSTVGLLCDAAETPRCDLCFSIRLSAFKDKQ